MSYAAYRKSSTWIRMALKVDGKHRNSSTHSCLALESKWKLRKSSMLSIEGRHRVVLYSLPNLNLISINIQCILLPGHNSCVCCEVFSFSFIIISMSLCVCVVPVRLEKICIRSASDLNRFPYDTRANRTTFCVFDAEHDLIFQFSFDGNLSQRASGAGKSKNES